MFPVNTKTRAQKMININNSHCPLAFSLNVTTPLPSTSDA